MPRGSPRPNNGGARKGGGRKKGSATKKTRAAADQLAADGEMLPLQVMVDVMRRLYKAKKWQAAAAIAAQAAPYMHPRLSSTVVKGDKESPVQIVERLVIVDEDDTESPPAASNASGLPAQ